MSLIPESESESTSPRPKRPNPLDPSNPPSDPSTKKPKLGVANQDVETEDDEEISDAELAELGLVRADLSLTTRERARKSWDFFHKTHDTPPKRERMPNVPEAKDPLPEGWTWGSYDPASGRKQFPRKIVCINCGIGGRHETDDCPNIESEDAKKFREVYGLLSTDEIKSKNK